MPTLKKQLQRISLMLLSATIILSFGYVAAQPISPKNENNESRNLKKYLKEKYTHVSEVRSTKKKIPLGQSKKVLITGAIAPLSKIKGNNKKQKAQAISKAFILEEPSIFGISNREELKELRAEANGNGNIHFKYRREIKGLPLEGMEILLTIGPDEKISYVASDIVQAPPELYEAIDKTTISKDIAIDVVKHDLSNEVRNPETIQILAINKIAISSSPWVAWKAEVNMSKGEPDRWFYWVNAFDGKILEKIHILQSLRKITR